ncbi:hypothetical protein PNP59_10790 [Halobacterium salinarum]|uniref:hypothetical protein n=1 Tax=Halobacterium salinarum TaxID=2242 RepID=UPI0025573D15|nr:hypothetical protein [Halobacterium salinarum]MDL0131415.1 hypothetical protein [Halobacterium salinarum]
MQIDPSTLNPGDHAEALELKSYQTFKQLFEGTTQARILTYCTTPPVPHRDDHDATT